MSKGEGELIGTVRVIEGDCLEVMRRLEPRQFTAVVTDPPYGLSAGATSYLESEGGGGGFMGALWDRGVPGVQFWQAALEVCLPGAYMLAFGGTRTYHRQTCAIEDSGWIIRDCLAWLYGSGFPKSLDLSKAIDKAAGVEREVVDTINDRWTQKGGTYNFSTDRKQTTVEIKPIPATPNAHTWQGWGTALKPALEPIVLAMRPREGSFVDNVLRHECGGLNIDGTRIESGGEHERPYQPANNQDSLFAGDTPFEPTNHPGGRWPSNVLIDDSDEVVELFPITSSHGELTAPSRGIGYQGGAAGATRKPITSSTGSAARFYYCAKASRGEREAGLEALEPITRAQATGRLEGSPGLDNPRASQRSTGQIRNIHPTVKPLALMRYLVRLVSQPRRNRILDPFAGSGTTGLAAQLAGLECVLIEQDPAHCAIIKERLKWALEVRERSGGEPPLDLSPFIKTAAAASKDAAQGKLF
jgi:DNA modification methylase